MVYMVDPRSGFWAGVLAGSCAATPIWLSRAHCGTGEDESVVEFSSAVWLLIAHGLRWGGSDGLQGKV